MIWTRTFRLNLSKNYCLAAKNVFAPTTRLTISFGNSLYVSDDREPDDQRLLPAILNLELNIWMFIKLLIILLYRGLYMKSIFDITAIHETYSRQIDQRFARDLPVTTRSVQRLQLPVPLRQYRHGSFLRILTALPFFPRLINGASMKPITETPANPCSA